MLFIFIYKKNEQLIFLNNDGAKERHYKLVEDGFQLIKTIDPVSMLSNIFDICQEESWSNEKINEIVKLLSKD